MKYFQKKIPRAVKEHPVMHRFSLSHQPAMASHLIRFARISLACEDQHTKKAYKMNILLMGHMSRLGV